MALADADWKDVDVEDVRINRAVDGQAGILRDLAADVVVYDAAEEENVPVGDLAGWIGWDLTPFQIWDGGDSISSDAERLGRVASELSRELLDPVASSTNVILIDLLQLRREARGHRITARIVQQLADILHLDPRRTLVVLNPEPMPEPGAEGATQQSDAGARRKIETALTEGGFWEWNTTGVWWRLVGSSR